MVWLVPSTSISDNFDYNADRAHKAERPGDMRDDGQCLLLCVCKSHSSIGRLCKYALRGKDTHSDKLNRDERREGRGGKVSAHLENLICDCLPFRLSVSRSTPSYPQ